REGPSPFHPSGPQRASRSPAFGLGRSSAPRLGLSIYPGGELAACSLRNASSRGPAGQAASPTSEENRQHTSCSPALPALGATGVTHWYSGIDAMVQPQPGRTPSAHPTTLPHGA